MIFGAKRASLSVALCIPLIIVAPGCSMLDDGCSDVDYEAAEAIQATLEPDLDSHWELRADCEGMGSGITLTIDSPSEEQLKIVRESLNCDQGSHVNCSKNGRELRVEKELEDLVVTVS